MSVALRFAAAAMLAAGAWCFGAEKDSTVKEEKPAMELGGNVLVDYMSDMSDLSDPTLQIGQVELGARINISEEVVASVLIKTWSKLDSLWIDQALVSYKPGQLPIELLFGQQTFNNGLLTTRLISFPAIYDMVDFRKPGIILNGSLKDFTCGFGMTVLQNDTTGGTDLKNLYSGVFNIDAALPGDGILRLSSVSNTEKTDFDLCGTINYRNLAFDFEGLMRLRSLDELINPSGFYAGALWNITERLGCAARVDGSSDDNFKEMTLQYTGGLTLAIKDGIYCSVEFSHVVPNEGEASDQIALELGLLQKIQLPGFQRKSLSRE
jgi:hypothetical protein